MVELIKASWKHKLGNFIAGFIKIVDGIILIFSLGNYSASLTLSWAIYRNKTKFLTD